MPTLPRQLRIDAARNRALVIEAAEAEFRERGMAASIADIAVRAGVAKGTVFRHFASKEELVATIVGNHFSLLIATAEDLSRGSDPGEALLDFMIAAADSLRQHDLAFLTEASNDNPAVSDARTRLHTVVQSLVERAQAAGTIRSDVTGTDILLLVCAPIHAVGSVVNPPTGLWRRYLVIVFDGLRPLGASPLPAPAPAWP